MKNENNGVISPATFSYVAKLFSDKSLLSSLHRVRKKYLKDKGSKTLSFPAISSIKKEISSICYQKSIPEHFAELFYDYVLDKEPSYPLSPSISIEAAGQKITNNSQPFIITDNKTGQPINVREISIKIHANISIDELIQFIENGRKPLEYLMDFLQLPQVPQVSRWKRTALALEIISLRDGEKLSFTEISKKLSDNENNTESEINFLSSEDNIKTLYHRYKKYFSSN
jgi:hypothetical protein